MPNDGTVSQHVILVKDISEQEALLISSALEAEGIDCHFKTEDMGRQMGGSFAKSTVFVDQAKLGRAKEIWASLQMERSAPTRGSQGRSEDAVKGKGRFWRYAGIFAIAAAAYWLGGQGALSRAIQESQVLYKKDERGLRYRVHEPEGKSRVYMTEYFDKKARRVEVRHSLSRDGKPYSITEFNADGRERRVQYDQNNDGKTDSWTDYGENQIPFRRETDMDFDGSPDAFEEMDSEGMTKRLEIKIQGKVVLESIYENGKQKETRVDMGRKGRFDTLFQYDALGVPSKISKISN